MMNALRQLISNLNHRHHQFASIQGERLARSLEALIAQQSLVANTAFLDCKQFPWTAHLEANWRVIRQELDTLLEHAYLLPNFQDISVDQYSITRDNLWKTYFFYGYGFKAGKNCRRCPQTTRLIEQIPGMKTAFFSILFPHKHIPEHRGPYKGVLRYHLGLKIPQPIQGCRLRIEDEIRYWREGESLMFDDTLLHEAWNQTDDIRVVLFIDVVRPMRFPFSCLNRAMIQLIAWSPYVQSGKRQTMQWESRLDHIPMASPNQTTPDQASSPQQRP